MHLPLLSCIATCSVEFHEKLFGYVDHTVDEVLSVPAFDVNSEEDPDIIEDGYQYTKRNRYIVAPY